MERSRTRRRPAEEDDDSLARNGETERPGRWNRAVRDGNGVNGAVYKYRSSSVACVTADMLIKRGLRLRRHEKASSLPGVQLFV